MLARAYQDTTAFDHAADGLLQPTRIPRRRAIVSAEATDDAFRQKLRNEMSGTSRLDDEAAAELNNRVAKQIVEQIVKEPIAAGGTMSDVMMLCESVIVGVFLECFQFGSDVKVLNLIVGRVKERLAKVRLEDLKPKGNG